MVANGINLSPQQILNTTFTEEADRYLEEKKELLARIANLMRALIGAIVACAALAGGITYLAIQRPAPVPYIVEVSVPEAEVGRVRTVGFIPHAFEGPTEAPFLAIVRNWLRNVRRISEDPYVMYEQQQEVMAHTGGGLQPWLAQTVFPDLRKRYDAKKKVEFRWGHMLPIAETARSFKVTWSEKTVDVGGNVVHEESGTWEATIVLAVLPPKEVPQEAEQRNPLGIFVTECHWAKVQ